MATTTPTPSAEATQPDPIQGSIDPTPSPGHCCARRAVLRAAGLVALSGGAVALAACSADAPTSAAPTTGSSPEASSPASSAAPSPSESVAESPSAAESSAAVPEGTPVAVSEVAVGGGLVVDEKYVVTQPTEGDFKAFSAICTHQGCAVGSVEDGVIVCPCHNSQFDITTGDPVEGPASEPLPTVKFAQSGDNIYVTG